MTVTAARLAVAISGSLLVAACGTTAQAPGAAGARQTGAVTGGTGLGDAAVGAASNVQPAGGPGSAGDGGGVGPSGGAAGARTAVTAAAGGTGQRAVAGGTAATVAAAPGVTATTIAVGLEYSVNSQQAAAALGAAGGGVGGGDGKAQWEILLKDINDHGGILGRKLVPVWYVDDATSTQSLDQKEQEACAQYTQDHKVFAVVQAEATTAETLLNCVSKAGAVQLYEDATRADATTFQRYPYYLETGDLRMDRVAAFWPQALQSQGYFSPWDTTRGASGTLPAKVGIVSFDDPTTVRAVEKQLEPALKAVGHPAADWIRVQYPTGEADNGTAISAIEAAELRFASEGITHVLPFDAQGAGVGAFFAQGADSQKYYPRYGLSSGNGAQTLVDAGVWPASQLNGAMGYGWVPLLDLRLGDNPDNGGTSNAARRYCVTLMAKHGQSVGSAIVERQVTTKCDTLHFLQRALETAGRGVTRDAVVLGANAIGAGFQSGQTFSTLFDASHHDGVAQARNFAYQSACGCFRYTGGLVRIRDDPAS